MIHSKTSTKNLKKFHQQMFGTTMKQPGEAASSPQRGPG